MSKIQAVEMGKYIEEYLSMRDISLIVLLLDIRHKPTEDDKLMYIKEKHTIFNYL